MAHKKSREQIHKNMSRVRNSDTALEKLLCGELVRHGVTTFTRNNKTIFGKPDIVFLLEKSRYSVTEIFGMDITGNSHKMK